MVIMTMMMHKAGMGPKHDALVRKAWLELRIQTGEQRGICGYQKQRQGQPRRIFICLTILLDDNSEGCEY